MVDGVLHSGKGIKTPTGVRPAADCAQVNVSAPMGDVWPYPSVTSGPIRKVCVAETMKSHRGMAAADLGSEGNVMAAAGSNPPLLTDSDVDAVALQFLNSDYVGDAYARWSLDKRLGCFLRRSGLVRVADDGDVYNIVLDRVMSGIGSLPGRVNKSSAAVRPAG
jgi:hypothetical protein